MLWGVSACATGARLPAVIPGQAPLDFTAGTGIAPADGSPGAQWSTYINARQSDVLAYEARYSMSGHPLGRTPADGLAGRNTLTQQTSTQLVSLLDAPLKARWRGSVHQDWAPASSSELVQTQQTTFSWAPAGATFDLRWDEAAPGVARVCDLSGTMRYDLPRSAGPAALLTGSRCLSGLDVPAEFTGGWRQWGAGVQWGAMRFLVNELRPEADSGKPASEGLYALDLSHQAVLGPWRGGAQVIYRSEPLTAGQDALLPDWSLQARMQRRMPGEVGLTAAWEVAPGLIPAPHAPAEVMSLGLSLREPLRRLSYVPQSIEADVNWRRTQAPAAAGSAADSQVDLQVSWAW